MRYLGLDLGTKTCGISISDATKTVATAYETIHFAENDYISLLEKLKAIIKKNEIEKIILGFPKNMNNTLGSRAEVTLDFKDKLVSYTNVEVVLQDERLSTMEANKYMLEADLSRKKRKQNKDSLAANIILQTYLDKEKGMK